MNLTQFTTLVKEHLAKLGVEEQNFELYYRRSGEMSAESYRCEVDKFSQSAAGGISLRVLVNGRTGYASTQLLSPETALWLCKTAVESAAVTENTDIDPIYHGDPVQDPLVQTAHDLQLNADPDLLIDRLIKGEQLCSEADPRISSISDSAAAAEVSVRAIINATTARADKTDIAMCYYSPVCKTERDVYNEYHMEFAPDLATLDFDTCAKKSVQNTLAYIGAAPVPSGSYTVALAPKVARSLLSCFAGVFSGLSAMKGLSLLKDKVGQKIAADCVTITDAPTHKDSLMSRHFDDAGVSTYEKNIVQNGTLMTLLHNLKTAAVFGTGTTGNAYRSSYTSPLAVAPQNLYVAPGESTPDTMFAMDTTVLQICETKGLHAGANPVTGDFSLECKGFLYRGGKLVQPVSGITVAGNFYTLLQNVAAVGSDLQFGSPGACCVGSPTLLIKDLSVAGK